MMEVSASEPERGLPESRGVPSMTERPGMLTPLAPWTSVMTPWAETELARAARKTMEYCMMIMWLVFGFGVLKVVDVESVIEVED
jgi:hypothetical protein